MDNLECTIRVKQEDSRWWKVIHTSTSCEQDLVSKNQGEGRSTNLLVAEIQELLELNATVRKGTEGSFFLELSGDLGVGNVSHDSYVEWWLVMWMMWSEGEAGDSGELYS
jgi:hypothetical protein